MPENQRCLFKIGIFYETAVTQKTMKMNVGYMCYVIASTFKKRIKHPPGHAPCDSYKISDRRKSDQWIPAVFFCALKDGSQFFWLYRKVKRGMLNAKKKDHYQIWQGRNPDGGYGGGVPEVLPAMVAAEKEGTEEQGGYGGAGIQDGVL